MTHVVSFVLAVISTVILLLIGLTAISDTPDVRWGWVGLAFLAAAVAVAYIPLGYVQRRPPT